MRVAAIDIGTNSVLLLVAEEQGGELVAVAERATITRLGQGVDATRALAPDAVERTLACLEDYASVAREHGAQAIAAVGTSAMRDARGGHEFRERAREILGAEPQVISGQEEARLTFEGALTGLKLPPGPVLVFDVGGGSTEIILGGVPGEGLRMTSLDIGSVRLTERHVRTDPPRPDEIDAVRADIRRALTTAHGALGPIAPQSRLIGVAGTVTTLAAFALAVDPYDASRIHGAHLSATQVEDACGELASLPIAERRTRPGVHPARADVIVAGGLIVQEVMSWTCVQSNELIVSDRGVRWGLARQLAGRSTEGP